MEWIQLETRAFIFYFFYPRCPVCIQYPFAYFFQVICFGYRRLPVFVKFFRPGKTRHHHLVGKDIPLFHGPLPAVIGNPHFYLCLVLTAAFSVFSLQSHINPVRLFKQHRDFLFSPYMTLFMFFHQLCLFFTHFFSQGLYYVPYAHCTDCLPRHFADFCRTLPVRQFGDPFYQQFRHVCGNQADVVKLQGFIQQVYKMPGAIFLCHFTDRPPVSHFPIHGLDCGLAVTLVAVLFLIPFLHQHPVIPFQELGCELPADFTYP